MARLRSSVSPETPMDLVLVEQPREQPAERFGRQPGALARGREGDADLGGPRLIGGDVDGAVAAQLSGGAVDGGQLQPRPGIAEDDALLGRDEALAVGGRVRGVPGLVAGDVGVAAVGDEGRHVLDLERSQHQPLGDDVLHAHFSRSRSRPSRMRSRPNRNSVA